MQQSSGSSKQVTRWRGSWALLTWGVLLALVIAACWWWFDGVLFNEDPAGIDDLQQDLEAELLTLEQSAADPAEESERSALDAIDAGALRGTVLLAPEGKPVAGARVRASEARPRVSGFELFTLLDDLGGQAYRELVDRSVFEEGGGLAETTTDTDGRFELRDIDAQRCYVVATSDEGYQEHFPLVLFNSAALQREVQVWLVPGSAFHGIVVDAAHEPVPRARCELFSPMNPTLVLGAEVEDFCKWLTIADEEGRFRFESLPLDRPYLLHVSAAGHARKILRGIVLNDDPESPRVVRLDPGGHLFGFVRGADGRPVEGAQLVGLAMGNAFETLLEGERKEFQCTSSASGAFSFDHLPVGRWRLYVRAADHVPVGLRGLDVREGEDLGPLEIRLEEAHEILGRVVDDEGEPVSAARIRAYRPRIPGVFDLSDASTDLVMRNETRTLADGTFRMAGIEEGPWNLEVFSRDHGRVMSPARTGEEVEIVAPRRGEIHGIVVSTVTGQPVPSFRISTRRGFLGIHHEHFDDAEGRFALRGLEPGTYQLTVEAPEHAIALLEDVVVGPGEVTRGVVVGLREGVLVRGQVIEAGTGRPVVGARIRSSHGHQFDWDTATQEISAFGVSLDQLPPMPLGGRADMMNFLEEFATESTVRSDPQGEFVFVGLPRKRLTFTAQHRDYPPAEPVELDLAADPRAEVLFELHPGGGIEGTVTQEDGTPVSGALIVVRRGQGQLRQAMSDEFGRYRFRGLADGTWTILLIDFDLSRDDDNLLAQILASMKPDLVQIRGQQVVEHDFVIPRLDSTGCTVLGTLTYLGEPVDFGTLTAVPDRGLAGFMSGATRTGQVKPDGSFRIEGIAEGAYRFRYLNARAVAHGIDIGAADLPGIGVVHCDLQLPSGEVNGRVLAGAEATPAPGVKLRLSHLDGDDLSELFGAGAVTSDEEGHFRFRLVPPGEYRLVASMQRDSLQGFDIATFQLGEEELLDLGEIWLDEGGTLEGIVVDGGGVPVSGALVTAELLGGGRLVRRVAVTGEDGRFRRPTLAAGNYDVSVMAPDGQSARVPSVSIGASTATELRIELGGGVSLKVTVLRQDGRGARGVSVRIRAADGVEIPASERWDRGSDSLVPFFEGPRPFLISGVHPGPWTLEVLRGDSVVAQEAVVVTSETTEFTVQITDS